MIYMVDHVFADPALEPEWHQWYESYLRKLVAVPGIHSAQRFKALDHVPSRYLAMYSIDSADVYTSEAYRAMGGGGSQSARFHGAYQLWTRNLFDAARRDTKSPTWAPAVQKGERVLVFDRNALPGDAAGTVDALESRATWVEAVGLHKTTKYRGFVVLEKEDAAAARALPGSFLYEPFTAAIS